MTDLFNKNTEQKRVSLALLGYNAGMYEWNMIDNSAYYSQEWKVMLGYHKDAPLPPRLSTWKKLVHPDDIDEILSNVSKSIARHDRYIETVHRLEHKNGNWIWILGRGFIEYNQEGKPIKMVGIHTNITEQKEQELKLKRLAQMLEQTHDSVISTDLDGNIETWNKGSEALFGYTSEEVIGRSILLLQNKDDSLDFASLLKYLKKDNKLHTQTRFQTKDGKFIDVDLSLSTYRNDKNDIVGVIGYSQNITKRLQIEKELANHNHNLEQYLDSIDELEIGLFVVQEDYTIQYMNKTMKKWFGNQEGQICYSAVANLSQACDYCQLKDVIQKDKKVIYEPTTSDGRTFHIVAKSIINSDGSISKMEIIRDITEVKKARELLLQEKEALHYKANHDFLTQLPNRALFKDRLDRTIVKAKRNHTKIALLFIDIDHFKDINDNFGHDVGDQVLKEVGMKIDNEIREEDTLARLGGDEFTIIIENLKEAKDVIVLVEKILATFKEPLVVQNRKLQISISIGISIYPDNASTSKELIKYADIAMYSVKQSGRNNYSYY